MKLDSCFDSGVLTVSIMGDIDHHESVMLREAIDSLIVKNKPLKLIFDLSKTEFMDSSGLGLILGRYRFASNLNCSISVLNANERVMKILTLAGVNKLIEVERSTKDEKIG